MVSFVEGCLHNGTLLRPWATGTTFIGTVIALASITLETNATLAGRALARNGAGTLDSNTVSVSSCSVPVNSPPVLSESFSQPTMVAGGDSTMTITMSNPNDTAATITSPFTDTLPSGVVVVGSASTTTGGTVSAPIGGGTMTLTGGSIPANGTGTITVEVTARQRRVLISTRCLPTHRQPAMAIMWPRRSLR
jgi:hypothetical protein